MNGFDSGRRDLLRMGGFGLASGAVPAVALAGQVAAGAVGGTFDIRTYGAKGDGKTLDTPAVNRAIEAAAAAGGGTVVFPAGTYVCFSIHLKSYVHLYLGAGATILAADSPKPGEATGYNGGAYDAAEPKTAYDAFQDYGHNHWHNSLLWGESIHDLSITGPGRIDGQGLSHGRGSMEIVPFRAEQAGVGNKAIALKNCRNVTFRDFSVRKGGHFCLLLTGVDNLTIDNLVLDTDRDGMDIDCCKNVRVSNCTVNSPWDDGICPKSSFALGYNRATENLTITNCFVTGTYKLGSVLDGTWKKFGPEAQVPRTGRIKFGTESNGGFKNTTVSNCVFEGCQGFALETVDGAIFEDITISNITMREVSTPFFLRLGSRLRGPRGTGDQSTVVGTLRRVMISNVSCFDAGSRACSALSGIPEHLIEEVKLANIYIQSKGGGTAEMATIRPAELADKYPEPGMFGPQPAHGFFLRHLRNLEMSHVEMATTATDARVAVYLEDVHRADFLAVTAPAGQPAFAFHGCTEVRVGFSRAAKDAVMDVADGKMI